MPNAINLSLGFAEFTARLRQAATDQSTRIQITRRVLEAADDPAVIAACRRIIEADQIGWDQHGNPSDLHLVVTSDAPPQE